MTMKQFWMLSLVFGCASKDTEEVRLGNAPPGPIAIQLLPPTPTSADDLTVDLIDESVDPEGESVEYIIEWSVDGALLEGVESMTLESMFTARGERWSVLVTAFDGVLEGGQAAESIDILNSLPTVEFITISPDAIQEKSEVTCEYGEPIDLDNDIIQQLQTWAVNGSELDVRGSLFGTDFDKGDDISCWVYADDGVGAGEPHRSSSVTVLNTVPHVIGCSLEDNEPAEDLPLGVESQGFIDEDDDPEGYVFQWYVNAVPVSTEAVLSQSLIDAGDNVYVECTAWDGEQAGNTVTSGHGTVVAGE
jgi:hypothetical protein